MGRVGVTLVPVSGAVIMRVVLAFLVRVRVHGRLRSVLRMRAFVAGGLLLDAQGPQLLAQAGSVRAAAVELDPYASGAGHLRLDDAGELFHLGAETPCGAGVHGRCAHGQVTDLVGDPGSVRARDLPHAREGDLVRVVVDAQLRLARRFPDVRIADSRLALQCGDQQPDATVARFRDIRQQQRQVQPEFFRDWQRHSPQ
jgi:hypothetical protein